MSFCVLVKISKRLVSFWYKTDENPYARLVVKDSNQVPLYFYVSGNDFIFGRVAKDLFYRHDPHAYGDYFEIVKDPSRHFTIYGNQKPVKQLFYYGVEQYLSFFINTVLYKGESIESYRQHFPLRFLFEADMEEKEKKLIENLFTDAGYFNTGGLNYDTVLLDVLVAQGFLAEENKVLLLNGLNDTLYLKLYGCDSGVPISSLEIKGQGADPRVRILAEMIIEYIVAQNSFLNLNKEAETGGILFFCAGLLQNLSPVIKGEAELSDGNRYWFRINERTLNDRLQYYSKDLGIYSAIDDLLKTSDLQPVEVTLVLTGEEISTSYFSSKLLKKYPYVKIVEPAHFKETMRLAFIQFSAATPAMTPRQVPVTPPVPVNSTVPAVVRVPPVPGKIPLPPLPPKKENAGPPVMKPQLPTVTKPAIPAKVAPVLPPPLPMKKNKPQ